MEGGGPPGPSQAIPVSGDAYCNSSTAPVDAAGSSSPAVGRKLLFRRMLIGVNDGRYFHGLFHCIDKHGNIILQDAVEYRSAARHCSPPTEQRCLGLILIPAACRSSCQASHPHAAQSTAAASRRRASSRRRSTASSRAMAASVAEDEEPEWSDSSRRRASSRRRSTASSRGMAASVAEDEEPEWSDSSGETSTRA
ncbi:uncharacterized protein [Miscanthus floridulus]|uniref:uncharacterized protein n=1 Tax=Miscanthus floridulus TaxID=154761 RepID=UPI0034591355